MNTGIIFVPSVHRFVPITKEPKHSKNNDGDYHLYHCPYCGIHGKRFLHESCITLIKEYPKEKIAFCNKAIQFENITDNHIQIIRCYAAGANYNNITPNNIHKIVEPPCDQKNDNHGIWIDGMNRPVRVMFDEFEFVDNHKLKKRILKKLKN